MDCKHERVRCTNNHFFCLLCGAELPQVSMNEEIPAEKENASEAAKKPVKRRAKKGAE